MMELASTLDTALLQRVDCNTILYEMKAIFSL